MKAAATGDPLVLEQADLEVTVTHLLRLRSAHLRARQRDISEARIARAHANDSEAKARLLKEIATASKTTNFTTQVGHSITDRTVLGDYIADHVQVLLNQDGGQTWLGHWSPLNIRLKINRWDKTYVANLLISGKSNADPIRLGISAEWIEEGQHWRFAHAIERLIAEALNEAEAEMEKAQRSQARANDFERRSHDPFPQEEELTKRTARKNELDAYTSLVAAAKGDASKRDEVEAMRARLLKECPSSETPRVRTIAVAGSNTSRGQTTAYERTIKAREMTFQCACCRNTTTQERYPSPKPLYCSDICKKQAEKEQTRLRVQRLRERRKAQ